MTKLQSLWRGDIPLQEAFWTWAVGVGLAVNIASSVLFLALIAQDRVWIALFIGYGLSVPYNILVAVGVWRSAGRYNGPASNAELARIATLVLMLLLSFT